MVANIGLSCVVYVCRHSPVLYFLCIQLNFMIVAGIFALFPTPVYNTFGTEKSPQIYSIILFASMFGSAFVTFFMKVVYPLVGAEATFIIGGVFSVFSVLICF